MHLNCSYREVWWLKSVPQTQFKKKLVLAIYSLWFSSSWILHDFEGMLRNMSFSSINMKQTGFLKCMSSFVLSFSFLASHCFPSVWAAGTFMADMAVECCTINSSFKYKVLHLNLVWRVSCLYMEEFKGDKSVSFLPVL